jgi:hypothetical protein
MHLISPSFGPLEIGQAQQVSSAVSCSWQLALSCRPCKHVSTVLLPLVLCCLQ